jgi:4-alpha-glucanotransferase
VVLGIATLTMLGLSWPLWGMLPCAGFPRVPFASGLVEPPALVARGLFALLLGALAAATIGIAWRCGLALSLGVLTFLVLGDQHRFQAWVYQFAMIALLLAALPDAPALALTRWWYVATYAYSGLSKLDASFCRELGPRFLDTACRLVRLDCGSWPAAGRTTMILAMPATELLIALCLSVPAAWRLGRVGTLVLHGALIALLGPWGMGHSTIVLIWNAAMLIEVWIAFAPRLALAPPRPRNAGRVALNVLSPVGWVARGLWLVGVILPLGERFGACDAWPAHALYASHVERTEVFLHEDELESYPEAVRRHAGGNALGPWRPLDLTGWSLAVRGVPVYPQARACNGLAEALALGYREHRLIRVVQWGRAELWTGRRDRVELLGVEAIRRWGEQSRWNAHPACGVGVEERSTRGDPPMRLPRASGILLHPTSLPGRFGIGDLGPQAHAFLEFLVESGQRWWQMLPLGPLGAGNSPYQSYSSYAGNPLLISPEGLVDDGWLTPGDWKGYPVLPDDQVDFAAVAQAKETLFRNAFGRFRPDHLDFESFREDHAHWLDDYALYMALKEVHQGAAWISWAPELVRREPGALARCRTDLAETILYYQFIQFAFDRQWRSLREACRERAIHLIGDVPIFVALDSADVWARPDLFQLDELGHPLYVAGVPPDYFSATGQLWGNPLYRWEAHESENFAWWIARLRATTGRVDLVRLDHFRGFQAYWEVPAEAETAAHGRWALGPGTAFLEALRDDLGGLPLIAEDLGEITAEVLALRDRFDLPGMRVLQFAFGGDPGSEFHLPHRYVNHCFAYTGTHDNDTAAGWFHAEHEVSTQGEARQRFERTFALRYLGTDGREFHWDLIRVALASIADTVIIPLQDVLGLDGRARMNTPGTPSGNWAWRFPAGLITPALTARLADMTAVYSRFNGVLPAQFQPPQPVVDDDDDDEDQEPTKLLS